MSDPPSSNGPPGPGRHSLYDDDDEEDFATVVDASLFNTPQIPDYPALSQFGRFEILGRIARGGMAEVFLGRERDSDGSPRHVVVKQVLPEFQDNQEFLDMFLEEGKMATRLYHPNVCHVYECGDVDGRTFMALEWVYGVALRKLIRRTWEGDGLPPALGAKIISKVAAALHYVHNATGVHGKPLNIIHRDVSPHNVMISWDGTVKLLDFGIAKTSSKESQTDAGVLKGKYSYLSPEQARGERIDARADIFALGICLYETLTGKPLYHRESVLNTLTAITDEPVPSAKAINPAVPERLDAIVKKALAKEPADRYVTAGEMQTALEEMLVAEGEYVDPTRLKKFLDKSFDEVDKEPMPKRAQRLTGSVQTGTPSVMSGSFGPFGSNPRPADGAPPAPPVAPPPPSVQIGQLGTAPPSPAMPNQPATFSKPPTWRPAPMEQPAKLPSLPPAPQKAPMRKVLMIGLAVLFVLVGVAAGALAAVLLR